MELLPKNFEDFNTLQKEQDIKERLELGMKALDKMKESFRVLTEDIIRDKLKESKECPVMERANQIIKEWIESLNDLKLYNYEKRVADMAANRISPPSPSDTDKD